MSHFDFGISTIFCSIEIDLSGNTVRPQVSKNSQNENLTIYGIFDKLLSTKNVDVARFARSFE